VTSNALDVGFAYDGDADRCIAVDEFGRVVNGDLILYVCGKELKKHGELNNNKIVTTVMSNIGLYKALDEAGIGYAKTQVGDKYVYENMVEEGNVIGGEQSGHIIFSKHATTGDGILTSLKIVETMIEEKQTLAQLIEPVKIYPQLLINVRVKDKKVVLDDPDIKAEVDNVEKALKGDGRALVRASGTEPVIRVMVEASTDALCHEYVLKVVNKIKEKGYAI
jgi:phosphoglucosamine mutase